MVQLIGNAIIWRSGLEIDGDGAPNAYAPDGSGLHGLDFPANAGGPGNWYGVVCNSTGQPIVQGANDPAPGFYVSQTALADRSKTVSDPRRYVDSTTVPYVTCTRDMKSKGVMLGDVALVFYKEKQCAAVVADVGPHPGEGSIALANALGIPSSPKNGGISSPVVSFIVFCGSTSGWPRLNADVALQAQALFASWGGMARLSGALGTGNS